MTSSTSHVPLNTRSESASTLDVSSGESTVADLSTDIAVARRAEYVAFLHRHPFVTDAYRLGFTTGIREDCRYQTGHLRNVDLPVVMLDNDFRQPDLDRYLALFRSLEPQIGVIGDASTAEATRELIEAARTLRDDYPQSTLIIVPKCRAALDIAGAAHIDGEPLVLGYAMGYSDVGARDFSDIADWRGLNVHLLGASPPKQWTVIQQLTQPTLANDPPADIVGVDWNGPQKVAYKGKYWSRSGWRSADHLSIRETVKKSLTEIRAFWYDHGVWPLDETPVNRFGSAVKEPDDPIWAGNGADLNEPFPGWGDSELDLEDDEIHPIEDAIVVTYEDGRSLAYRSETERAHVEYYEGLWDSVVDETPRTGESTL